MQRLTTQDARLVRAVGLVAERCPRLRAGCYWAGTAAVAIEVLRHRQSFDLDFHTCSALADVRPLFAELRRAFPGRVEVVRAPDRFGDGFRAVLALPDGEGVPLEVLSNYEDVPDGDLVESRVVPGLRRVAVHRYLADKVQCLAERAEARDLADIAAVLRRFPRLERRARALVAGQDALVLAERLLAWTAAEIEADLAAWPDASARDAEAARDRILGWLRDEGP